MINKLKIFNFYFSIKINIMDNPNFMDNPDARKSILNNIDQDLAKLFKSCAINSSTTIACSRGSYWKPIFEKYDLPFPIINYDEADEWLLEFGKQRKLKFSTDRLMNILEHPKIDDFENVDADDLNLVGINIETTDVSFLNVFNVKGINFPRIATIYNKDISDILSGKMKNENGRFEGAAVARMKFENGQYLLEINYNQSIMHNGYEYIIDRNAMKQIFYNILSFGVVPRDDINGDFVRLI